MRNSIQVLAITALALAPFSALRAQQLAASAPVAVADSGYTDGVYDFRLTPGTLPAVAVPGVIFSPTPWRQIQDGEDTTPHYELFVGYSNFRNLPMGRAGNRIAWLSGVSTSIAFNVNRHVGIVVDFGGYHDTRFGPNAAPTGGVVSSSGNAFSLMTGPRVSFRGPRFTPFVQALFGEMDAKRVTLSNCTGPGCMPLPTQSSFSWSAGGGLDITLTRHIAFRLFQAEYAMTRFPDPTRVAGPNVWQHDARISTGLVFRFGRNSTGPAAVPAPPPAPVPVAQPQAPNRPPTMTCSAYPSTINVGDIATVTAVANSPEDSDLTYSWTASRGSISGTSATAGYDSTGMVPGNYTVRGRVVDVRGGSADCSTTIAVVPVVVPPVDVLEATLALHSIYFPTDQPRADNPSTNLAFSQRAILRTLARDFKVYLQSKPDASLTLEGHADERASVAYNEGLAQRRLDAAKNYLVAEGIPAEKIATQSFGKTEELDAAQVRSQFQADPNLSDAERQKLFANFPSIILAQNRRVDIILTGTGQKSTRQYPFNATDALSLLSDTALVH
ncbi:MAG TPA: OmpA family protein [Terriglobales bacterium]|nr:OmpA family protein [Terriglobales bacterium]